MRRGVPAGSVLKVPGEHEEDGRGREEELIAEGRNPPPIVRIRSLVADIGKIIEGARPLRRHHTVGFDLMNNDPRNSNRYYGFH